MEKRGKRGQNRREKKRTTEDKREQKRTQKDKRGQYRTIGVTGDKRRQKRTEQDKKGPNLGCVFSFYVFFSLQGKCIWFIWVTSSIFSKSIFDSELLYFWPFIKCAMFSSDMLHITQFIWVSEWQMIILSTSRTRILGFNSTNVCPAKDKHWPWYSLEHCSYVWAVSRLKPTFLCKDQSELTFMQDFQKWIGSIVL